MTNELTDNSPPFSTTLVYTMEITIASNNPDDLLTVMRAIKKKKYKSFKNVEYLTHRYYLSKRHWVNKPSD